MIKFGKKNAGAIRDTKETQKLIANSEAGKLVTHIEELRTKGAHDDEKLESNT